MSEQVTPLPPKRPVVGDARARQFSNKWDRSGEYMTLAYDPCRACTPRTPMPYLPVHHCTRGHVCSPPFFLTPTGATCPPEVQRRRRAQVPVRNANEWLSMGSHPSTNPSTRRTARNFLPKQRRWTPQTISLDQHRSTRTIMLLKLPCRPAHHMGRQKEPRRPRSRQ